MIKPPSILTFTTVRKVSNLRGFSSGNFIQVLVINIDSFAKDENIINKPNDKLTGKRPIEFIQSTKPFVIVDEPQNMETEISKESIENLRSTLHLALFGYTYKLYITLCIHSIL
jgi:type III restriction enzyme